MLKRNYIYVLNHLKINIAQKNYYFDLKVVPNAKQMLQILYSLGIIRRFYRLHSTWYRVYPAWRSSTSAYKRIKVYSHTKNPLLIKLKALKILKHNVGGSNLVLNTTRGIITHQQALKLKLGGHLICIVF